MPTKHPVLPAEISRHGRHLSTRVKLVLDSQTPRAILVTPEDTVSDHMVSVGTHFCSGRCTRKTPKAWQEANEGFILVYGLRRRRLDDRSMRQLVELQP